MAYILGYLESAAQPCCLFVEQHSTKLEMQFRIHSMGSYNHSLQSLLSDILPQLTNVYPLTM